MSYNPILTAQRFLSLSLLLVACFFVAVLFASNHPALPNEGVLEKLGEAWKALAEDPTRAIREGRAPFIWITLYLTLFALVVKVVDYWYEPDISPFGTSALFVVFTVGAIIFSFMCEAGASAYGWYNYMGLFEPYKTMFCGKVLPGTIVDPHWACGYWGGWPFDAWSHKMAGVTTGAILLNFRIARFMGFGRNMQETLRYKGAIVFIISTFVCAVGYEFMSPQVAVEYWNALGDIANHGLGTAFSVLVFNLLVPQEKH